MNKLWKIFQYGYLIIGILFIIDALRVWNQNRSRAYTLIGFAIFILFIFLFMRNFRKRIAKRNKED